LPAIAPIAPYDTVEIIDSNPPLKQLCSSA